MIRALSLLFGALLLLGFTEPLPQPKPLDPEEAAKQGKELATGILAQVPAQNFTNIGVLKTRADKRAWVEIPVKFETLVTATNWQSIYEARLSNRVEKLFVIHAPEQPNVYFFHTNISADVPILGDVPIGRIQRSHPLSEADLTKPFAGSDFWIGDLGLEFLHWQEQRILKVELRKTLSCKVLESINPHPASGAYSRVVSWIDSESGGLVHADAYDGAGKWLKEFDPKSVKEVDGQPQLVKMEMYNRQTRSRSQIEFDLGQK